jgi:hypothetical protein
MEPTDVDQQLVRSRIARAVTLCGDLLWHFERGADFSDAFACYSKLIAYVGHEWSDVQPDDLIQIGWPGNLDTRLGVYRTYIAPAIRNVEAADAERHWRKADAIMLGYAQKEIVRLEYRIQAVKWAAQLQLDAKQYTRARQEQDTAAAFALRLNMYRAALALVPPQDEVTKLCAKGCGNKWTVLAEDAPLLPTEWVCNICETNEKDRHLSQGPRFAERSNPWG